MGKSKGKILGWSLLVLGVLVLVVNLVPSWIYLDIPWEPYSFSGTYLVLPIVLWIFGVLLIRKKRSILRR